jgi:hypothetical protein
MTSYELNELLFDLNKLGFSKVRVAMVMPRKSSGIHWCVVGEL